MLMLQHFFKYSLFCSSQFTYLCLWILSFLLALLMRKCWGQHSCMCSTFPIKSHTESRLFFSGGEIVLAMPKLTYKKNHYKRIIYLLTHISHDTISGLLSTTFRGRISTEWRWSAIPLPTNMRLTSKQYIKLIMSEWVRYAIFDVTDFMTFVFK